MPPDPQYKLALPHSPCKAHTDNNTWRRHRTMKVISAIFYNDVYIEATSCKKCVRLLDHGDHGDMATTHKIMGGRHIGQAWVPFVVLLH